MIKQFVCNSYSDKLKLLLCLLVETFLNVLGCWEVVFEEREGCLVEEKLPVGERTGLSRCRSEAGAVRPLSGRQYRGTEVLH